MLYYHNKHLMGYFEFLHGWKIISLLSIFQKNCITRSPRNARVGIHSWPSSLSIRYKTNKYWRTTSFNQTWTQARRRFKTCLWRVRYSRWWQSLTMVLAGKKLNTFRWSTILQKQFFDIITTIVLFGYSRISIIGTLRGTENSFEL